MFVWLIELWFYVPLDMVSFPQANVWVWYGKNKTQHNNNMLHQSEDMYYDTHIQTPA